MWGDVGWWRPTQANATRQMLAVSVGSCVTRFCETTGPSSEHGETAIVVRWLKFHYNAANSYVGLCWAPHACRRIKICLTRKQTALDWESTSGRPSYHSANPIPMPSAHLTWNNIDQSKIKYMWAWRSGNFPWRNTWRRPAATLLNTYQYLILLVFHHSHHPIILPTAAYPSSPSGFTIWISQTVYCYFWAYTYFYFLVFFCFYTFLVVGSVR